MELWTLDAAAWLSALGIGVAGLAAAAAALGRDRARLRRLLAAREGEIERLQDRLWALSESEERFRGLVEAQLDVIVRRDGTGRITYANDGFAALLGQPRAALVGTRETLRVVETRAGPARPDGARLLDEAIEADGTLRWIAWIETPVAGPGGASEILRAGREVTERVVSEQVLEEARTKAEAASEAKSRFLATVSHEVRTPLNGILGMADLLLDTPLSPEQDTYARAVKTSGEALLSLVDEILDFSKIEAGRLDLRAEPFDLSALVEGVVELLAPRAQDKGLEIAAFIAPNVPRRVVGDADRLRQVLVNLAGNAVKFTDGGGVGLCLDRDGAGEIVLSVADSGPGIPLDRVPALFAEFEQGDGSPSRRHGGTGLGLAITRRIIERMGGAIEVDSTVGTGSTFRVRVPLPGAGEEAPAENGPSVEGQRLVILAHSPFEAPFLARRLWTAGADAVLAETAPEALAAVAAGGCDALLVDCALGPEVTRAVAPEARLAGAKRCFVLLSPFDRRPFGSPHAAGFDGYLVKPVRPRSLLALLAGRPVRSGAPPAEAASPAVSRETAARVLLAEDNQINALLAMRSLEKLGAVVDWAKDGREALALAEASLAGRRPAFDLVLMDIRMPGLDGYEATRRVRQAEAASGRPPIRIVALTANALPDDEAAAKAAGFDGFLPKPFAFEALRALLDGLRPPMRAAS
jgi:PAS domain S-box-containing protein